MGDALLTAAVAELLFEEARLLDERRWHDWLVLYRDDAVFWVPAYTDQSELVTDPELQINLIYITSKKGLDERVFRIETGDSVASTPTPRTCHLIANVVAEGLDHGEVAVRANWQVASYTNDRGPVLRNGHYQFVLRGEPGKFQIAYKKIVMLEEKMESFIDFYSV
jgi:3-phenylpropionate/cinnamic acid dioxygenase small subunit